MSKVGGVEKNILKKEGGGEGGGGGGQLKGGGVEGGGGGGGGGGGHLEGLSIEWRLKPSVHCGWKFKKLVWIGNIVMHYQ